MSATPAGPVIDDFADRFERLAANISLALQGKSALVRTALCCVLAEGHLLLEDVPGVGKTSLARALAASVDLACNRIQFTPDLLPSDVTGTSVFDQSKATFSFRPGPIFANVVIADEINRASPKTQSALLEVMQEHTVTTDAIVHRVPRPFVVVATQNPVDLEGTYLLPEAQLDRFAMRLSIGYPAPEVEAAVLRAERDAPTVGNLAPVLRSQDVTAMIESVKSSVEVAPAIDDYVVALVAHTRAAPDVRLGVSPRGALTLVRVARVGAAAAGRPYVVPDDVKAVAEATLAHRIVLRPEAELAGRTQAEVVARALQAVPVPRTVRP